MVPESRTGSRWARLMVRPGIVLAVTAVAALATTSGALAATGGLSYQGCVSGDTALGPSGSSACAEIPSATPSGENSGLHRPAAAAVSAEGNSLYVVSAADASVARFDRDPSTGALTYQGCITGSTAVGPSGSGACAEIPSATGVGESSGLFGPVAVAVSADGRSVYTASASDAAVARFDRDPTTGALSYQGCITGSTAVGPSGSGACAEIPSATSFGANSGLFGPVSVAVSADGSSLYVASAGDAAVARFDRDPSTGALSYQGCITGSTAVGPSGSGACAEIPSAASLGANSGLYGTASVAVSADGGSLYAAALFDTAVARFDRDPSTGALTYQGCITGNTDSGPSGTGACAEIPSATSFGVNSGLFGPVSVVVSPDGNSAYVASLGDSAVARFDRDPSTGVLSYQGCITGNASNGPSGTGACAAIPGSTSSGANSGLFGNFSVAMSADGKSLYTAALIDSAVVRFDRDPSTGVLSYQGCITGSITNGPTGTGACAEIPSATTYGANSGLFGHISMAVSADGNSVYLASLLDDAVARFDREPDTTITSALVRRHMAIFRFASSEPGSTFECKLGPRGFTPCASPRTYKRLRLGRHVFEVRATDRSNTTDSTPAKHSWRIRKHSGKHR